MKIIITLMLLVMTTSTFAKDVLYYEELPDCFFKMDRSAMSRPGTNLETKIVAIDTCNTKDVLSKDGRYNWPQPVGFNYSAMMVDRNKDTLIARNKIFTNQISKVSATINNIRIFKDIITSNPLSVELNLDDIKPEFSHIKALFLDMKKNVKGFKIMSYMDSVKNGKKLINQVNFWFDHPVSVKFFIEKTSSFFSFKDMFVSVHTSVNEASKFDHRITNNTIELENIEKVLNVSIYDLSGQMLTKKENIQVSHYKIDMSGYKTGVYFIKINDTVIKFCKMN